MSVTKITLLMTVKVGSDILSRKSQIFKPTEKKKQSVIHTYGDLLKDAFECLKHNVEGIIERGANVVKIHFRQYLSVCKLKPCEHKGLNW